MSEAMMPCTSGRLKERIWAYDFAKIEINLYLDTHPEDHEAQKLFCAYGRKRDELVALYEERFGPYIVTADDACGEDHWAWNKDPWPWEFVCAGKE